MHTIIVCNQRAASIQTYAVNLVTHCCNVTLAEYGEACNASRRTAETTVPHRCGRIRCTSDNNTLQCGAVPVGFRRFGAALSVGQPTHEDRRAESFVFRRFAAHAEGLGFLAEWAHPSLTWSTMRLSFQRDQPTDRSYSCLYIEYSALLNRTNPYQDCGTPTNGLGRACQRCSSLQTLPSHRPHWKGRALLPAPPAGRCAITTSVSFCKHNVETRHCSKLTRLCTSPNSSAVRHSAAMVSGVSRLCSMSSKRKLVLRRSIAPIANAVAYTRCKIEFTWCLWQRQ